MWWIAIAFLALAVCWVVSRLLFDPIVDLILEDEDLANAFVDSRYQQIWVRVLWETLVPVGVLPFMVFLLLHFKRNGVGREGQRPTWIEAIGLMRLMFLDLILRSLVDNEAIEPVDHIDTMKRGVAKFAPWGDLVIRVK